MSRHWVRLVPEISCTGDDVHPPVPICREELLSFHYARDPKPFKCARDRVEKQSGAGSPALRLRGRLCVRVA